MSQTESTKLSCLIIEDEPIAAEVLEDYIRQINFLDLKGVCRDAIFAMEQLQQQDIDVIFLDIHLPKLKGLDFLKSLPHPPQTILTTAYHQYAIDAYELNVVDYLMKPIEFARFLKAVNKLARKDLKPTPDNTPSTSDQSRTYRFFNVNKKKMKVYYDEIQYIESLKDYSRIITADAAMVTRGQLGEMEELFRPHDFLRIHRSYLINLEQITAYSASEVEVAGKPLPIGRSYKELVAERLTSYFKQ